MAATSGSSARRLPALTKYDVLEELGHGGMATVYRAHDKRLSRDVALKVIHPHLRDSKEVKARFFVEAKAVAKLRHPNIVEVYDVSSEGEHEQYLVVELLRGKTLRTLLRAHGAIPPEVAAALAIELLAALAHAHGAGVVHRDVKPENVILEHRAATPGTSDGAGAGVPSAPLPASEPPGDRISVKLTDFGIAKLLDAQGVTSTGQVLGSPAHMAPEQIEGGEVDPRADVFGLGVLLYECMVGHLPFQGANPAQVLRRVLDGVYPSAERERSEVGRTWSRILDQSLARRPEERFANAGEMRDALVAELKRVGVSAPRAELEAWFDDPEAYAQAHRARMIEKLCELGGEARRAGNAVRAAADYNRALAYAPTDPQLLRIVAGMDRAETRARVLRRVGPAVVGALALGVAAFFVTRALRERPNAPPNKPVESARAVEVRPDPAPPVSASPAAALSTTRPVTSVHVSAPGPIGPPRSSASAPPSAPSAVRTITLVKMTPRFGALVAVDDGAPVAAPSGKTLSVDGKPHALLFSCVEDLCDPQTRVLVAGEGDESLEVELTIKPARLTIVGDRTKSYVIVEMPQLTPQPDLPLAVPMRGKSETVHVKELLSGETRTVPLVAGRGATADFSAAP